MTASYRSKKIIVRDSLIDGKGVFSSATIHSGEIVWIRSGHVVHLSKVKEIDIALGDFSLQIDDEYFLSPKSESDLASIPIYFNHSCNPNIFVDGLLVFRAGSEIPPETELTVDSATIEARQDYKFNCNCLTNQCRQTISGNDWKHKEIQERYDGKFSQYVHSLIVRNV